MSTLYLVGVPEGDPNDVTLRALRILRDVALVVAADVGRAQRLLVPYDIATPLVAADRADIALHRLEEGDVALLSVGSPALPHGPSYQLVRLAIEQGFPVVPVPGPDPLVAALVISGLPADGFVYLGELPHELSARRDLLTSVAGEQRTFVIQEWPRYLPNTLDDLYDNLGNRPLVIVAASEQGTEVAWRGAIGEASEQPPGQLGEGRCVLVVGGARGQVAFWDEAWLRAEIQARLDQGLGVKEISRQLAAGSGRSRREIYRLAVETAQSPPGTTASNTQ